MELHFEKNLVSNPFSSRRNHYFGKKYDRHLYDLDFDYHSKCWNINDCYADIRSFYRPGISNLDEFKQSITNFALDDFLTDKLFRRRSSQFCAFVRKWSRSLDKLRSFFIWWLRVERNASFFEEDSAIQPFMRTFLNGILLDLGGRVECVDADLIPRRPIWKIQKILKTGLSERRKGHFLTIFPVNTVHLPETCISLIDCRSPCAVMRHLGRMRQVEEEELLAAQYEAEAEAAAVAAYEEESLAIATAFEEEEDLAAVSSEDEQALAEEEALAVAEWEEEELAAIVAEYEAEEEDEAFIAAYLEQEEALELQDQLLEEQAEEEALFAAREEEEALIAELVASFEEENARQAILEEGEEEGEGDEQQEELRRLEAAYEEEEAALRAAAEEAELNVVVSHKGKIPFMMPAAKASSAANDNKIVAGNNAAADSGVSSLGAPLGRDSQPPIPAANSHNRIGQKGNEADAQQNRQHPFNPNLNQQLQQQQQQQQQQQLQQQQQEDNEVFTEAGHQDVWAAYREAALARFEADNDDDELVSEDSSDESNARIMSASTDIFSLTLRLRGRTDGRYFRTAPPAIDSEEFVKYLLLLLCDPADRDLAYILAHLDLQEESERNCERNSQRKRAKTGYE